MLRRGRTGTAATEAHDNDDDDDSDIDLETSWRKRRSTPPFIVLLILLALLITTVLLSGFYWFNTAVSNQNYSISSNNNSMTLITDANTSILVANRRNDDDTEHTINPFPRWDDERGIDILPLLNAVQSALEGSSSNVSHFAGTRVAPQEESHYETVPTFQRVYVVDVEGKLWVAQVPNRESEMVGVRAEFMEPLVIKTLEAVLTKKSVAASHLQRAIFGNDGGGGGLLYVVSYGDAHFCCNDYYRDSTTGSRNNSDSVLSIRPNFFPILTLSAPVGDNSDCQFTFPIPTYDTIIRARKRQASARKRIIPLSWGDRWLYYWWSKRERMAVWRGSPTGPEDIQVNLRWRLCEQLGQQYPDLIDAKFVRERAQQWPKLLDYPHLLGESIDTRDYQLYRAIIDIDGNSWSARFGQLLCSSSVVIKVEPRWVDYFYPELQAWRHYIPVRSDLSDLVERVQYAVSDQNNGAVQKIIANANHWCQTKMKEMTLIQDMAHILDAYAELMLRKTDSTSVPLREQVIPNLLREYNFTRLTATTDR